MVGLPQLSLLMRNIPTLQQTPPSPSSKIQVIFLPDILAREDLQNDPWTLKAAKIEGTIPHFLWQKFFLMLL